MSLYVAVTNRRLVIMRHAGFCRSTPVAASIGRQRQDAAFRGSRWRRYRGRRGAVPPRGARRCDWRRTSSDLAQVLDDQWDDLTCRITEQVMPAAWDHNPWSTGDGR
jgi:hypothetical protein